MSEKKKKTAAPAGAPLSFAPKAMPATPIDQLKARVDVHDQVLDMIVRELGLRDHASQLVEEHGAPAPAADTSDDDDDE